MTSIDTVQAQATAFRATFDSLKATFTVEKTRVRTEDLVITTPDYTITGTGSVGFDRSTNWNGILLLSPRLTQEVQRDYRIIRYLLDRRGRLPISFRLEGKIPNVKIRLDNRALAARMAAVEAARAAGEATVPTTIALERATNPFMRASSVEQLAERRAAKDVFRG